ncbi:hypothetical protein HOY80DRAFT_963766 [Tuber brumale]|nr:hypothetical protein HOY80DRAFT_963766 [Tuber brumale]
MMAIITMTTRLMALISLLPCPILSCTALRRSVASLLFFPFPFLPSFTLVHQFFQTPPSSERKSPHYMFFFSFFPSSFLLLFFSSSSLPTTTTNREN